MLISRRVQVDPIRKPRNENLGEHQETDTLATRLKIQLAAAQTGTELPILTEEQEEFVMFAAQTKKEETTCDQLKFIGKFFMGVSTAKQAEAHTAATGEEVVIKKMTVYEKQAKLEPHEGVFSEFSNILLQLGYVVLFAPAFPLASALLWTSFYFELRTDAFKMVKNTRRPPYMRAEDIGAWQTVLRLLAALGVLTNLGLINVTETTLERLLPFRFLGLIEVN
jgi:hypothetical protein